MNTEPPPETQKPYSIATLAERWSCTPSVIRRMIKRGDIKVFRVGTLLRISAQEVERWETGGQTEAQKQTTPQISGTDAARLVRMTGRFR